jgi:hypothetical protein
VVDGDVVPPGRRRDLTAMPPRHDLQVGDQVQLRDPSVDAVGTVVELLHGHEHVRVEWLTGAGFAGKRIMLSARALLKRPTSG